MYILLLFLVLKSLGSWISLALPSPMHTVHDGSITTSTFFCGFPLLQRLQSNVVSTATKTTTSMMAFLSFHSAKPQLPYHLTLHSSQPLPYGRFLNIQPPVDTHPRPHLTIVIMCWSCRYTTHMIYPRILLITGDCLPKCFVSITQRFSFRRIIQTHITIFLIFWDSQTRKVHKPDSTICTDLSIVFEVFTTVHSVLSTSSKRWLFLHPHLLKENKTKQYQHIHVHHSKMSLSVNGFVFVCYRLHTASIQGSYSKNSSQEPQDRIWLTAWFL